MTVPVEVVVRGSEGLLVIDCWGRPRKRHPATAYSNIECFDLAEFQSYWGYAPERLPELIDILDLSYSCRDGTVIKAEASWREGVMRPIVGDPK